LSLGFYILRECSSSDSKDMNPKSIQQDKQVELKMKAPIGELFQPTNMTEKEFLQYQSK